MRTRDIDSEPRSVTRVYPICCTSAYCGKGSSDCPNCKCWPILREFKEWRDRTNAVCADEIWCPLVYTGTEVT